MEQLATMAGAELALGERTRDLIGRGVSANTLKAYRQAMKDLDAWLRDAAIVLSDGVLALYLTDLHDSGKSPATVSQVVAAVKWQAKNLGLENIVGAATERTLAGIRRNGKERGRGQVDGITWSDMERVCGYAEVSKLLAGLSPMQ